MAQHLRNEGYRAYALTGGLDAWRHAGFSTQPKETELGRTVEDVCSECGQPVDAHRGP